MNFHWYYSSVQVQRTIDTAREGKIEPIDKKDETVRGTLPLFKLRSRADRAKWQKLVIRLTGNFYTESDCKLKPFLCRHFRLERLPPVVLPSPASTRWTLPSCQRSSWTFNRLTRLTGEKLPSNDNSGWLIIAGQDFNLWLGFWIHLSPWALTPITEVYFPRYWWWEAYCLFYTEMFRSTPRAELGSSSSLTRRNRSLSACLSMAGRSTIMAIWGL